MKEHTSKPDAQNKDGLPYATLLDDAVQKSRQGGSLISHLADEIREDFSALNELSKDEIALMKAYIKRDLTDAATYLDTTGKELKDWFGFDLTLIESKLLHNFAEAADQTTLELIKLKQQAALSSTYSTGEVTGIGTLICDGCETKIHFHQPGHIPPCAKCHGTRFHREVFSG
jgi:hypothetical protein